VHDEIYDQWFQGAGPQTAQKLYETIVDEDCNSGGATPENDRIDQCVNDGAAMLTYAGHGGYKTWGKNCSIYETKLSGPDDLDDLTNADKLVFTVQANCITGHFSQDSSTSAGDSDTWFTFLEDWLVTADKGSVAGMAPSHLTYNFTHVNACVFTHVKRPNPRNSVSPRAHSNRAGTLCPSRSANGRLQCR